MKKVFLVIAIIGIILCGCGRTLEESIKTESSATQNDNGVRIQSCELPYDGDKEMYIDSVYLQDKLQVLSLAMENDDFVLKRSVMSEVGVWEEHKEELDGEIKKHIGYVSPEMHRAYLKNLPAIEIVASGLHDSIGLYRRPQPEQMDICEWWMDVFGIAALKDKAFLQLSSGEQRLALLARAFVKDPELLILDEPLHGLDTYNRRRVKKVIEAFCQRKDKTMIMVTHYESELPGTITDRIFLKRN